MMVKLRPWPQDRRSYKRSVFGAYPRLDILPELRRQRQHFGSLLSRYGRGGVIRYPVALAAQRVELAHQRSVDTNGVSQRFDRKRMVPGSIGVGPIPGRVQRRSRHGKGRVVGKLESSFRAQPLNAGVSQISIGQREQSGDFLS